MEITYEIASTSNNKLDISSLADEISNSTITIALDYINSTESDFTVIFKADISIDENTTLNTLVSNHTGEPLPENEITNVKLSGNEDPEGSIRMAIQARSGSGYTMISHNFADKKSWWMLATRHINITLTPTVPGVYDVFNFGVEIIDTGNGKITFEDREFPAMGEMGKRLIRPVIYIDTTEQLWSPLKTDTENGYTIDYTANTLTFNTARTNSEVVSADFYEVNDSTACVRSTPGKKLRVEYVEVQFSSDVDFTKRWFVFQPRINYPGVGVIDYGLPAIYKSVKDFLNESNNSGFVEIPAMGELTKSVYNFVWQYTASKDIHHDKDLALAELHIYTMEPNTKVKDLEVVNSADGAIELATVTMYCMSEDDT